MQRSLIVKSKGVVGKAEVPYVVLKDDRGTVLNLKLNVESELEDYPIGGILTVKIVNEQQTLTFEEQG